MVVLGTLMSFSDCIQVHTGVCSNTGLRLHEFYRNNQKRETTPLWVPDQVRGLEGRTDGWGTILPRTSCRSVRGGKQVG